MKDSLELLIEKACNDESHGISNIDLRRLLQVRKTDIVPFVYFGSKEFMNLAEQFATAISWAATSYIASEGAVPFRQVVEATEGYVKEQMPRGFDMARLNGFLKGLESKLRLNAMSINNLARQMAPNKKMKTTDPAYYSQFYNNPNFEGLSDEDNENIGIAKTKDVLLYDNLVDLKNYFLANFERIQNDRIKRGDYRRWRYLKRSIDIDLLEFDFFKSILKENPERLVNKISDADAVGYDAAGAKQYFIDRILSRIPEGTPKDFTKAKAEADKALAFAIRGNTYPLSESQLRNALIHYRDELGGDYVNGRHDPTQDSINRGSSFTGIVQNVSRTISNLRIR